MVSPDIDLELIKKQDLFANLKKEEIEFIINNSSTLVLKEKEQLFSSGEKAAHFYILKHGEIRVYKKINDTHEGETAKFTAGDTIGDFDFARGADYDAWAEAAQNAELIMFPGSGVTMDTLSQKEPAMVCSIMLNAIVMMTGRIKQTNRLIFNNMSWVQDLHRRAYEDSGTGLWKQTLIADEIIGALTNPSALIMIKPDRFKILVDSRGHAIGDEAMIRIALILKNITRVRGHGWALRLKSNETGIIFNNCSAVMAEETAKTLAREIAAMEPAPAKDGLEEFKFSATISWTIWPLDDPDWESLYEGNYANLLYHWKKGGERIVRYTAEKTRVNK
ncbi:MAG: diguanylate cyclase [Treponema sp.]|nr:diguanylate cyclase [Treponema sp.]